MRGIANPNETFQTFRYSVEMTHIYHLAPQTSNLNLAVADDRSTLMVGLPKRSSLDKLPSDWRFDCIEFRGVQ